MSSNPSLEHVPRSQHRCYMVPQHDSVSPSIIYTEYKTLHVITAYILSFDVGPEYQESSEARKARDRDTPATSDLVHRASRHASHEQCSDMDARQSRGSEPGSMGGRHDRQPSWRGVMALVTALVMVRCLASWQGAMARRLAIVRRLDLWSNPAQEHMPQSQHR